MTKAADRTLGRGADDGLAEEIVPGSDVDTVLVAGGELLGTIADIAYHHTNPGEGWSPFAEEGDVPAVIAEVLGHIERLEAAIRKAKADIASVKRPARLAAVRRRNAEEASR